MNNTHNHVARHDTQIVAEERFSYARLLAFMARVDNELTVDEMAMFEQRLGAALLSPNQRELIRQALKTPPPLDECLAGLSEEAGRLALRDAILMAAADGTVDDDEKEVLMEIIAHLGPCLKRRLSAC
ncbi:MAG: hypothetical protein CM15mP3_11100 [Candidatus Poseidoniales archaeon]|nr:MAG: hypothetical protein CM15mP3_11100 [Candidatus Poseidoniales archaeon]